MSAVGASARGLCPEVQQGVVSIVPVKLPAELKSGLHRIDTVWTVLLEIEASGESGLGYAFAFAEQESRAIVAEVENLFSFSLGPDMGIREAWRRMWQHINHIGQAGPPLMALSVVDTALWDLAARYAALPLYRLLGGSTEKFPLYGSGGWLTYSLDELLKEASWFAEAGYGAYKMKVGGPDWSEDIRRVASVVELVGDALEVMVDVNQAWSAGDALNRVVQLADLGVRWVEEPVDAADLRGLARVTCRGSGRIAAGESLTLTGCVRDLIGNGAVDVVMPDLMRSGGPTGMGAVMSAARVNHVALSPHLFPEVSAHVLSAFYGSALLEDVVGKWADACFESSAVRSDGYLDISRCLGIGLRIRDGIEPSARLRLRGPSV